MMRAGIFGQFNVSSGSAQAFDVGPARSHRYVIIRSSMEHPNGNGTDIGITNECSLTRGIERNVRGEGYSRTPGLLKSLEAGVECRLSAARESHHRDAGRIDPRMVSDDVERPISIEDHVEAAEQRLVGRRTRQPAFRETVDDERHDPHLIESFCPKLMAGIGASRPMLENNCRQ